MKGTLFSADFAPDSSDNLRLLEINTDTGIASASFQHFNFDSLYSCLSNPLNFLRDLDSLIYEIIYRHLTDLHPLPHLKPL